MRFISLILCVFLAACASQPQIVLTPIPTKGARASAPEKVILPISKLTRDSVNQEIVEAYIRTVRLLILDNNDCRARLNMTRNL